MHTDVHPDDGPRYAQNMYRLTKYTENKLWIKFVFLYTINWDLLKKKVTILEFTGKRRVRTRNFSLPEGKGELTPKAVWNLILKISYKNHVVSITVTKRYLQLQLYTY